MPPLYRILEIIVYSLLNFLPYMALAIYPFRNRLRFSAPVTVILIVMVTFSQIILGLCAGLFFPEQVGILSAVSTLIYLTFYFLAIDTHWYKTLFTLLMLSNLTNLVVTMSKCIEGMIFPALAVQNYRWSFSLVMIIIELAILTPLYFYIKQFFSEAFEKDTAESTWRLLWLIPVTFYIIWYYHLYGSNLSSLELALQPSTTIFVLFINLGALLIYHIVIHHVNVIDENVKLEQKNHELAMQNLQYHNLQYKITEARQAKHDIRHHISIMRSYLQEHEYDKLEEYLSNYQKSLPDDSTIVYCANRAINVLLLYFAQEAKANDIEFSIQTHVPENLCIPENDLSVLLGNILENAFEACISQKASKKRIVVKAKSNSTSVFFIVDNTFEGIVRQDKNGHFLSTKKRGSGLGLISVKNIVERYHGSMTITHENGIFCVSVMLNHPN